MYNKLQKRRENTREERWHQLMLTTVTAYYDEVRDVLDEEGGSDEDVDVGFFVDGPEVALPEVPTADERLASWESTKGLLSD